MDKNLNNITEGMFSTIDQIRQDSKDVRDFVKNVFADREFKKMSKDKEFIKYLKSIYEGTLLDEEAVAVSTRSTDGTITTRIKEDIINEVKYYITRNQGRGRGKSLVGGYDLKKKKNLPPKEFRTFKDAEKEVKRLQNTQKGIPGGGSAYFVTDKKMNPLKESVNEGKKRYYQKDGIGKSKYTISYHDGKKKHKDGSDFFDIQIFRNKKDLAKFVNTLHKGGYVYGFNESINERINPKFYDARVQYTDPKNKKKFVGDVVRYDNGEYKVNLGKDGRFEKYILAKEKDLKIVSKSKKKTFESVNEASREAMGIAGFTGTRGSAVQKFIDDYNLNSRKLFNFVKKGKLKDRMDFVTAIAGKPGNKFQGKMVGMFGEGKDDGVPQGYNPMVESKTKESKVVQMIYKYEKNEKKFYDKMAEHERRIGPRDYGKFIINALRGFGINPREFKRVPDAEEKLYQTVSKK